MPRNDPSDLQPPIEYKPHEIPRPLTEGEVKRAADRAEPRAKRMGQTIEGQSRSNRSN